MYTTKWVSTVKRAIWPAASRRSAQCAYASTSSRMARRSAASSALIATCLPMSRSPRCAGSLYGDERQASIPSAGQPGQRVHDGRGDHRDRRLAASRGCLAAPDDVDVHGDGGIHDVRRCVAVDVPLLPPSVLERDRSLGHELRDPERHSRLELALHAEWIDSQSQV